MRWEREREAVRGDACWEEEEEREEEETAKSSSRNSSTDQRTVLLPDFCESFSSARPKRRACCLNDPAHRSGFPFCFVSRASLTRGSTAHIGMQEPSAGFTAGTGWLEPSRNIFSGHPELEQAL